MLLLGLLLGLVLSLLLGLLLDLVPGLWWNRDTLPFWASRLSPSLQPPRGSVPIKWIFLARINAVENCFFIAIMVGMEVHTVCRALESQCPLSVHTQILSHFFVCFKYELEIILTLTAVIFNSHECQAALTE